MPIKKTNMEKRTADKLKKTPVLTTRKVSLAPRDSRSDQDKVLKKPVYADTPATATERTNKSTTKRILNCFPSRNAQNDWTMEHARAAGLKVGAAIPSSKDRRRSWWSIGNQGATGACVGWATADSLLRWHFVKAGKIAKSELMSPRFTWMASKETDQFILRPETFIELAGTSLKAALDIARKFGSVPDSVLPFIGNVLYQGEGNAFYATASQLKIANYFNLGSNIVDWRIWIATCGPILTRLNVDDTWFDAKSTHGNLDVYDPNMTYGGHAVALVGYTPDRFIVRNSWGTTWGDKGFGYASVSYAQDAFTEAYGVQV